MTTKIGIIGLGLMGASLGLALKNSKQAVTCYGQDIVVENINYCLQENIIDKKLTDDNIKLMDFIFIAVPVKATQTVMENIYPHLNTKKTIISDMGSTKLYVCKLFKEKYPDVKFIAGHPMTGGEKSGARNASADLYDEQSYILIDNAEDYSSFNQNNLQKVNSILQLLNCQLTCFSAAEHDLLAALTSHLPHLASFSFMNIFNDGDIKQVISEKKYDKIKSLVGPGFLDFTRISACEPAIWLDIFQTNKTNIVDFIDLYITQLQQFKTALTTDDINNMTSIINGARTQKENLSHNKQRKEN